MVPLHAGFMGLGRGWDAWWMGRRAELQARAQIHQL